jgi:hypothetical protein
LPCEGGDGATICDATSPLMVWGDALCFVGLGIDIIVHIAKPGYLSISMEKHAKSSSIAVELKQA